MEHPLPYHRTCLPVDVVEDDGLFTRGYVQDLFQNGDCLVDFDAAGKPTCVVKAQNVRDIYSPGTPDHPYLYAGNRIEVLLRLALDQPKRWHPATVLYGNGYHREECVAILSVTTPAGEVRTLLQDSPWENYPETYRHIVPQEETRTFSGRTIARFKRVRLGTLCHADAVKHEDFASVWQEQTNSNSLIISKCRRGTWIKVLLFDRPWYHSRFHENIENRLWLERHLRPIDRDIFRTYSLSARKRKRSLVDSDPAEEASDELYDVHGQLEGKTPEPPQEDAAQLALGLPELLGKIFRLLEVRDRQELRSLCRLWNCVMKSPTVASLVRLWPSSRREDADWDISHRFKLGICQSFTKHLTTLVMHCKRSRNPDTHFRMIQAVRGGISVLPHSLKRIVLIGGNVNVQDLEELADTPWRYQICLQNIRIMDVACPRFFPGCDGVFVPTAEIEGGRQFIQELIEEIGGGPDPDEEPVRWYMWNMVLNILDDQPLEEEEKTSIQKNLTKGRDMGLPLEPVFRRSNPDVLRADGDYRQVKISSLRTCTLHFLRWFYNE